jgi:hypothetical protein
VRGGRRRLRSGRYPGEGAPLFILAAVIEAFLIFSMGGVVPW